MIGISDKITKQLPATTSTTTTTVLPIPTLVVKPTICHTPLSSSHLPLPLLIESTLFSHPSWATLKNPTSPLTHLPHPLLLIPNLFSPSLLSLLLSMSLLAVNPTPHSISTSPTITALAPSKTYLSSSSSSSSSSLPLPLASSLSFTKIPTFPLSLLSPTITTHPLALKIHFLRTPFGKVCSFLLLLQMFPWI